MTILYVRPGQRGYFFFTSRGAFTNHYDAKPYYHGYNASQPSVEKINCESFLLLEDCPAFLFCNILLPLRNQTYQVSLEMRVSPSVRHPHLISNTGEDGEECVSIWGRNSSILKTFLKASLWFIRAAQAFWVFNEVEVWMNRNVRTYLYGLMCSFNYVILQKRC